jgi:hypothetical protein
VLVSRSGAGLAKFVVPRSLASFAIAALDAGAWPLKPEFAEVANLDTTTSRHSICGESRIDDCRHCRAPLVIVVLRFGLRGTRMVASCSNCSMAFVEDGGVTGTSKRRWLEQSVASRRSDRYGVPKKLEQLSQRTRHAVGCLLAAVVTAGALRHVLHMYGGIPPDTIRAAALLGVPATIFSLIVFHTLRR